MRLMNSTIISKMASEKTSSIINKDTRMLYSLFQQEYNIMAEYKMLQSENLHGVYVIPSFESSFLWFGVIFVRCGIYEGAVFRFELTLPETFPSSECPVVTFKSSVYHPAIDANTGILNLSEVFPNWEKSKNHIWQILQYVHWIFHNINVKTPANVEAVSLYKTNRKLFMEKVKECIVSSIDHLYDEPPTDDKHYISFTPYDPSVHDPVKASMLKPPSPTVSSQGLSWVQNGTFQAFSKEDKEAS